MTVHLRPFRGGYSVVRSDGVVLGKFRGIGSKRRALGMIERHGKVRR